MEYDFCYEKRRLRFVKISFFYYPQKEADVAFADSKISLILITFDVNDITDIINYVILKDDIFSHFSLRQSFSFLLYPEEIEVQIYSENNRNAIQCSQYLEKNETCSRLIERNRNEMEQMYLDFI